MHWEEIVHRMPGPGRVDSDFGAFTIASDHPPEFDREGRAPEPWNQFLASIGSCMASFVMAYCAKHELAYDGIELIQRQKREENELHFREIAVEIRVPDDFPPEHRESLAEAARNCTVKRVIENAPVFRIETT